MDFALNNEETVYRCAIFACE